MLQLIIAASSHDGEFSPSLDVTFHKEAESVCRELVRRGMELVDGQAEQEAEQALVGGFREAIAFLERCEAMRYSAAQQDGQAWETTYLVRVFTVPEPMPEVTPADPQQV